MMSPPPPPQPLSCTPSPSPAGTMLPSATTPSATSRTASPAPTNNNISRKKSTTKTQTHRAALEDFERVDSGRAPFVLTRTEVKLLGIAGVGFFLDAYDLFIINPVSTMLMYRLYTSPDGVTHSIPAGLEGFLKAGANIGSVIGQFGFGYAADALGRKAVYGKELMLIILATILTLTTPTGTLAPNSAIVYLACFRILLGIGVGGDYPMSATITSDRANIRKRGTMLAYIFSAQGWGSLIGSVVTIIVLKCYEHSMRDGRHLSHVDGVWRIVVGISLIPAFATLYHRLTLPESVRFQAAKEAANGAGAGDVEGSPSDHLAAAAASAGSPLADAVGSATGTDSTDEIEMLKREQREAEARAEKAASGGDEVKTYVAERREVDDDDEKNDLDGMDEEEDEMESVSGKAHFGEFLAYFSEWRHAKILIGTCVCWFLLDISFYGINLNQNVVLTQIGFDGSSGTPWERLFRVSIGNLIVTALGFVPGYYGTVLFIEVLGRKTIQIMGFLLTALFLAILAGCWNSLTTVQFVVCFALLQFFFNFGPNATAYCYPAEVFPTRFKAFAHGISAAAGKAGAIISALAFNTLSQKVGTPVVLWIFFGVNIVGAAFTLLLPEVKGRDPDLVLAQEIREKKARAGRV